MDIRSIPTNELISDLNETRADIRLCELALELAVTEYGEASVNLRLEANRRIESMIKTELDRRREEGDPKAS